MKNASPLLVKVVNAQDNTDFLAGSYLLVNKQVCERQWENLDKTARERMKVKTQKESKHSRII